MLKPQSEYRNPFTGEDVPRTAQNIIRGFITLLPGGAEHGLDLAHLRGRGVAGGALLLAEETLEKDWDPARGIETDVQSPLTLPSIGVEAAF